VNHIFTAKAGISSCPFFDVAKIHNSLEGKNLCNILNRSTTNKVQSQNSVKMEVINQTAKRTDTQLLLLTHLSQLLTYVTGFGGLIVPLIIWLTQKDKVEGMDEHGKAIVNFQISMYLLIIISIPAIFLLGLGILTLILVGIISFILPIVNAIKASKGEDPSYFMTIRFIS
jgi:uncharacterized protein